MLKSKNIKSRLLTVVIAIALTFAQMITAFADSISVETDELSVQTEPTMWLGQTGNGWCTVPSETGENSVIYTKETPHGGCKAYHTIGYALFLSKEENKGNAKFDVTHIDTKIEPLFYFPSEGIDEENIYENYNVAKYINLEEVAEKFRSRSGIKNPYTRRLFLTPIITYRNYINGNVKADSEDNYADLVKQMKRDDDDIFTLSKLFEEHKNSSSKIEEYYFCNDIKFDYIKSKGKGWSASSLLPYAAFYADTECLNEYLGNTTLDGKAKFAPYSKCQIYSCLPKGKSIQSFAPGKIIPIIEPEDTEQDKPSITGPLPILTYTSFPANSADGKSGDPVPDSAIGIDGEYYFGNKPKQKDYDWSEKGGGYIPVTEDITAYVKADNWIGQSQFAQCHDSAVYRVYFKIKYTKPKRSGTYPNRHWEYPTKTYKMYVDVPRDVYYWKLYSFSGYKLTNITLINGSYPDKTISFDFDPPMSEKHLYYNDATSKYITNNVDWTGIGCADTITIDVTGTSNRLNEGIAKAYATATNYVGFPTAWNDALSITTDTKTLTYLTDDKVKMSRSNNRTGSYAKTRQSVNPEHILNEFPEE